MRVIEGRQHVAVHHGRIVCRPLPAARGRRLATAERRLIDTVRAAEIVEFSPAPVYDSAARGHAGSGTQSRKKELDRTMANTKSATKAARQAVRRTAINKSRSSQ